MLLPQDLIDDIATNIRDKLTKWYHGNTIMRNKHYPAKTFKLDVAIIKQLNELKKKENLSWNLLFKSLILNYGITTPRDEEANRAS